MNPDFIGPVCLVGLIGLVWLVHRWINTQARRPIVQLYINSVAWELHGVDMLGTRDLLCLRDRATAALAGRADAIRAEARELEAALVKELEP
jgi:hypothetical protein